MAKKFRLPIPRFGKFNRIDNDEINRQFQSVPDYLNSGVSGANIQTGTLTKAKIDGSIADNSTVTFDTELKLKAANNITREHFEPPLIDQPATKYGRLVSPSVYLVGTVKCLVPAGRNYFCFLVPGEAQEYYPGVTVPRLPLNVVWVPGEDDLEGDGELPDPVQVDYSTLKAIGNDDDKDRGIRARVRVTDGTTTVETNHYFSVSSSELIADGYAEMPPGIVKAFIDTSTLDADEPFYEIEVSLTGYGDRGDEALLALDFDVDFINYKLVAIPL